MQLLNFLFRVGQKTGGGWVSFFPVITAIHDLKRIMHIIEKAKNTNIIIADGKIITTYKSK